MSRKKQAADQRRIVQGWKPVDKIPSFARPLSEAERDGMQQELEVLLAEHHRVKGFEMSPRDQLQACHEVNLRWRTGAAPVDLCRGIISGGPLRGVKLAMDKHGRPMAGLSPAALNRPLRVQLAAEDPKGLAVKLSGVSTGMGNTTGDRALIESVADTNIFGGTTGLLHPVLWDEILVKWSRSAAFLPMAKIGIVPALVWEQLLDVNTIYDELFEGTNLQTLKAAIIPRVEGAVGGPMLTPKLDRADHVVSDNYMWHTARTWEEMVAMRGSFIGAEMRAQNLLGAAPLAVQDYNLIQAAFWALEVGYQRRWDKTNGPAWEVAAAEVPFGKATFITSEAYKHQAYWNPNTGAIYHPHAGANYRKYHESTAVGSAVAKELAAVYGTKTNKILEVLLFMAGRMREKGRRLSAVFMPHWLLEMYGMDDRAQNRLYAPTTNPRFQGAAGYVGTLPLLGFGEPVDIFTYDAGSLPAFATTDTAAITYDGLILGFEPGQAVTLMPFISPTLIMSDEMALVNSLTQPTGRQVLSLYHSECIEAYDPRALFMVKIITAAHA